MPPCPLISMIFNKAGFAAGWTRQSDDFMVNKDMHLLPGNIDIDAGDLPGKAKLEKKRQGLFVGHG
jgi:hypothetical protein